MVVASKRKTGAMPAQSIPTVAIVGAGFSGTLLAIHLLRRGGVRVVLIGERLGRGVAYSTTCNEHLLNVPAAKMSAFVDTPLDFLDWCRSQNQENSVEAHSFVPRKQYGAYLEYLLAEAKNERLEYVQGQAINAMPRSGGGFDLQMADGGQQSCDRLVLAIGNALPANPSVQFGASFYDDPRYIRNPWCASALADLDATEPVLLIGSGLTMVDKVIELRSTGFTGSILALSRRGLLPASHPLQSAPFTFSADQLPSNVRSLCQLLRRSAAQHTNWQSVIDALRPHTVKLWQSLPLDERRRFLRHVRPYWEVMRHRLAPSIHAVMECELANKSLSVQAGRLLGFRERSSTIAVHWLKRGSQNIEIETVQRVINCTGPQCRLEKIDNPLLTNLHDQGLLRPDPLYLGVDADTNGGLIDLQSQPSDQLFALGCLLRGQFWESTAVPELRVQAEKLATLLCQLHAQK